MSEYKKITFRLTEELDASLGLRAAEQEIDILELIRRDIVLGMQLRADLALNEEMTAIIAEARTYRNDHTSVGVDVATDTEAIPTAAYSVRIPSAIFTQMEQSAASAGIPLIEAIREDVALGEFLFGLQKADELNGMLDRLDSDKHKEFLGILATLYPTFN